ncbi:MAG: transporter substrate-binding domain-containing protein [Spirochaetales bacterium]|nr:transporter substrate-binding domain-containing protein [Spirochaetales bacterium]
MNNKTVIILLVILLFVTGCQEKGARIIVEEESSLPTPSENRAAIPNLEENKPLIILGETDPVKIVVRADGAPGMYLGDDGEVHGFYVDLERMIMAEMEQTYEFIPYTDVGPIVQGIKSGVYHIGLATPDLPDYRSFLNLSIPYEILQYVTFIQSGNKEISGTTKDEILASLHGKKVGVQTQGHIYQELRDIKEIELIEYPTTTQALEDLDKGFLDAVPDVKRIGLYYSRLNGWDIKPVGGAIISHLLTTSFSKMVDTSLMDRYNQTLEKIIADGRLESLYESYFGPMGEENKPW